MSAATFELRPRSYQDRPHGIIATIELVALPAGTVVFVNAVNLDRAKERTAFLRAGFPRLGLNGLTPDLEKGEAKLLELRDGMRAALDEQAEAEPAAPSECPYRAEPGGITWDKPTRDGSTPVSLANFTAVIAAQEVEDDGSGEARRVYRLVATYAGREAHFSVPASRFAALGWVDEHLAASAFVSPGFGASVHLPVAIRLLSGSIPERQVFTHTGWRLHGGTWVYLHHDGAIGPDGPVPDVETHLSAPLNRFTFPETTGLGVVEAVRTSLQLLDGLAPDRVMVPLLGAVFRAVLGQADFNMFLAGPTGTGKSALAALAQQFFGAGLDADHLPASWASTANANERLAFLAKDAVVVIDDFCPTGSLADVQRLHRDADRLFRGAANRQGRQRMQADISLRAPTPPRGLLIGTGEDVPKGQSLGARLEVLAVEPGAVNFGALTSRQAAGSSGIYAQAMAALIQWLAVRYDLLQRDLAHMDAEQRGLVTRAGSGHRRSPTTTAKLGVAWRTFLLFAEELGAVSAAEAEAYEDRVWLALLESATAQAEHQHDSDPVARFISLVQAVLASGGGHVASLENRAPGMDGQRADAWGWSEVYIGDELTWRSNGARIGWIAGGNLYLDPDAAYAAVQQLAQRQGEPFTLTRTTLTKRLHERGILASTDADRGKLTVRRTVAGKRRDVLHFSSETYMPTESAQPAQPAQ